MKAALAGEQSAAKRLFERIESTIWNVCRLRTSGEEPARDAFFGVKAALAGNNFARLAAYKGGSRLETFVALVCRELLAERVLRVFQENPSLARPAFDQFFTRISKA